MYLNNISSPIFPNLTRWQSILFFLKPPSFELWHILTEFPVLLTLHFAPTWTRVCSRDPQFTQAPCSPLSQGCAGREKEPPKMTVGIVDSFSGCTRLLQPRFLTSICGKALWGIVFDSQQTVLLGRRLLWYIIRIKDETVHSVLICYNCHLWW